MRRYDAVIFDLDGTLLDTSEGISGSVGHVIKTLGLEPVSNEVMRSFIGPPIQKSFARVYGLSEEEANNAADLFRARYKDRDLLLARPYNGIIEAIKALSDAGIKSGVATYKRQDYAERILTHFGFDRVCDVICGSDAAQKLTKRDIIENAIKALGADKDRVVMVGDSDNDAIGADEIGVDFLGVTYGFGFATEDDVSKFRNVGCAANVEELVRCVL